MIARVRMLQEAVRAPGEEPMGDSFWVEVIWLKMTLVDRDRLEIATALAREGRGFAAPRWKCIEVIRQEWLGTFGGWAFFRCRDRDRDGEAEDGSAGKKKRRKAARAWRTLGSGCFAEYCSERLGMSRRTARCHVWLERQMCALAELREALTLGSDHLFQGPTPRQGRHSLQRLRADRRGGVDHPAADARAETDAVTGADSAAADTAADAHADADADADSHAHAGTPSGEEVAAMT